MVRILLVDKNGTGRGALHSLIANLGAECVDGTEPSITTAANVGCDVVFLVNPERIYTLTGPVPVLVCYTANPGANVIAQAVSQGAAEVLVMPFSTQLLTFKLQQLGVRGLQRAA